MRLIIDLNMRMVEKFLLLSQSIAMAGITQIMTARLEELESMRTEAYAKPKVTILSYKVTQKGLNHFNSARARSQETPSDFEHSFVIIQ